MKIIRKLLCAFVLTGFSYTVFAQTTFVFDDGNSTGDAGLALEGKSSTTYTQDGIELTASTTFGSFNLTNAGFGPNDVGGADDPDFFDGTESMVFSFNTAGIFNSIDFASLGGSGQTAETATLSFAGTGSGATTLNLRDDSGNNTDIVSSGNDLFENIAYSFAANEQITLSITAGNGWTLESFNVIPEPSTYALLSGICAFAFVALGRRRK